MLRFQRPLGNQPLRFELAADHPLVARARSHAQEAVTGEFRPPHLVLSGEALQAALEKATLKLPGGSIVGDDLQFARTPFVVEFQSGWFKFILCTVHIYYGSDVSAWSAARRRSAA